MELRNKSSLNVGIIGATGIVGRELGTVLTELGFPMRSLSLFASRSSVGRRLKISGENYVVQEVGKRTFEELDLVFFAAENDLARELVPKAVAAGAVVIDKSSAFRLDPSVPLVIPEINAQDIASHSGIIATPNCTTTILLTCLNPLHRRYGLRRLVVSTYQSVSGAGQDGVDALREEITEYADDIQDPDTERPLLFGDVRCRIGSIGPDGSAAEEVKLVEESRKILGLPDLAISATCARVPVERGHALSVEADFVRKSHVAEASLFIEQARPAVRFVDVDARDYVADYPTPKNVAGQDECYVGRIRKSGVFENGLSLFVCGDNLRKGAALNAVQIAELLINS